jgi:hypothetical protein
MLPQLCPAVMLAVRHTPGSVDARCAAGMAKGMARRQPSRFLVALETLLAIRQRVCCYDTSLSLLAIPLTS